MRDIQLLERTAIRNQVVEAILFRDEEKNALDGEKDQSSSFLTCQSRKENEVKLMSRGSEDSFTQNPSSAVNGRKKCF